MAERSIVLEKPVATGQEPLGDRRDKALRELVAYLKAHRYSFVTPTPASHARVVARRTKRTARDLRDIFGWSIGFDRSLLDRDLLGRLAGAGMIDEEADHLKSRVRVSSLGSDLICHSAYPTEEKDAVFFGPDSYRFALLIEREMLRSPPAAGSRLIDIGTGAGAGAIAAARLCPALDIVMTDINPSALQFARTNTAIAGIAADAYLTGDLSPIPGLFDLAIANPPYIIDPAGRAYRDGGDMHGAGAALTMARMALPRLAPGGRFILYTGSAIIGGEDPLRESLAQLTASGEYALRYAEIDPDVFGEELAGEAYREVERIALVSAVIERRKAP